MDIDAVLAAMADENGLAPTVGAAEIITRVLLVIDQTDMAWEGAGAPAAGDYARNIRQALAIDASGKLVEFAAEFAAGRLDKFEFYHATRGYPAATVAAVAGIDVDVVKDRRRYLRQLQQMTRPVNEMP